MNTEATSGQTGITFMYSLLTSRLAVFSWNVLQGYDLKGNINYDEVTKVIKQYQPDVIALQETNSLHQVIAVLILKKSSWLEPEI